MARLLLAALSALAIVLVAACGGNGGGDIGLKKAVLPENQATVIAESEIAEETGLENVLVLTVDTGTKIKVHFEGSLFDIRYIGIIVPDGDKVLKDGRSVRQAALELNRSMAPPQSTVQLEEGAVARDVIGNLFRYVYADGEMINIALVAAGLATVRDDPSDTTHQAELLAAQEEAKANGLGVWEP